MTNPLRNYLSPSSSYSSSSSSSPPTSAPWALVTGSTSGMGYEWSLQLARLGFNVAIHGRDRTKLEKVKAEIESQGASTTTSGSEAAGSASGSGSESRKVKTVQCDASSLAGDSTASIETFLKELEAENATLAVLINNVGVVDTSLPLFDDVSDEEILKMIQVNVTFGTLVAKKCVAFMKRQSQRGGSGGPAAGQQRKLIINVTSLGAWAPGPYVSVYSGTKAYNLQFSRALYNEQILESHAIDVVALAPGTVISGMNEGPPTSFMPLASDWVKSAIDSLAPSRFSTLFSPANKYRPPPVIVPWPAHARGAGFVKWMPMSLGDKFTRDFMKSDRDKKLKEHK